MSYFSDLGAVIPISGGEDAKVFAELQIAINRLIIGARKDTTLPGPHQQAAAIAAPFIPLTVDGIVGNRTLAALRSAGVASNVVTEQGRPIRDITFDLNQFSSSRGYSAGDTVKVVAAPNAAATPGPGPRLPGSSPSTTTLALLAVGLGVAVALSRRKARR